MQRVIDRMRAVAETDASVLITGESGTGKERVARAIHDIGGRREGPFVPLACAAIPAPLLEDEIFGHERGAFTDAKEREARAASSAPTAARSSSTTSTTCRSTTQVKLLRVLQEREVERAGRRASRSRWTSASSPRRRWTSREAVEDGEFREDLYYRLNVVPSSCRRCASGDGDIPLLVAALPRAATATGATYDGPARGDGRAQRLPLARQRARARERRRARDRAGRRATRVLTREILLEAAAAPQGRPREDAADGRARSRCARSSATPRRTTSAAC